MHTHTRALVVAALFATVGVVGGARRADAREYQMEAGVFIGAHIFSDTNGLGRTANAPIDNSFSPGATLGLRLGFIVLPRLSLEAELGLIPTGTKEGRTQVFAFGYRAHLLVHILTGRIRPFVLVGGGGFSNTSSNPTIVQQDTDGELHAGVGVKFDIKKNWGLRVDGRIAFSPAISGIYFTEDGEVTVGLYGLFDFGKKPVPAAPPVATYVPPADSDKDGITDDKDKCPKEAGLAELGGCPDKDGDGDTIPDRMDRCPAEAGPEANMGCPDTDKDKDGIVDRLDKCPEAAGPEANMGCPDTDADKDGVVDRLDKCPDKPETKNGFQDDDGCPDELPAAVKQFSGTIEGIAFENGKATLLKSSFPLLDKAAAVLKEYPALKMEIQGHTDNVGKREKNVALSQARAESVKAYLVSKGIDAARLNAKGYGPDAPKYDNKKPKERAKNRRVEFQLI